MPFNNWDDFFQPEFSRAVDGPIQDLKLGIDELPAVATLIADCDHHCPTLISEDSLQKYGLSKLNKQCISPFFNFFSPLF